MPEKNQVQSFDRGLRVLTALNLRNGATLGGLARETGLNRTIVYRLLETLRRGGFVRKDRRDRRYWLQAPVRKLSDGYADEAWIDRLIRPRVAALSKEFVWPVSFCAPAGTSMVVRVTSDFESPLTLARFPAGSRVSLAVSAAGQAYLSACEPAHRDAVLAAVRQSPPDDLDRAALESDAFLKQLAVVRRKGYALVGGQAQRISGLAVPVASPTTVVGALSLRFFSSAMTPAEAIRKFRPGLSACAAEIRDAF